MSDTAVTSFLGCCWDLLQTLMEVEGWYFHAEPFTKRSNILKVVGLQKELYKKSLFFIYSLRSFDLSLKKSDIS